MSSTTRDYVCKLANVFSNFLHIPSFEKTSTSHKLRLLSTPTNWIATYWPINGRAHANVFVVPSSAERGEKQIFNFVNLLNVGWRTYRLFPDTMHTVDSVANQNCCFPHESLDLVEVNFRSSHESLSARREPFVASRDRRATMATVPFAFRSIFVRLDSRYPFGHRWPMRLDRHVLLMTD